MIKINENSPVPIYLQIVEEIKRMILSGTYSANSRLPSIRQVAKDIKVNPNTVAKAFQELEADGMIFFKRGQGAFVAEISAKDQQMRVIEKLTAQIEELVNNAVKLGMEPEQLTKLFESIVKKHSVKGEK